MFFWWTVSVVCGTTAADVTDSKISNQVRHFQIESESSDSNLEASQVPRN